MAAVAARDRGFLLVRPVCFLYCYGGEGGIRTRGTVLAYTRFPSERLKPLSHLSEFCTLHASPGGIDSNRLRAILGPSARLRYRSGVQNAGAFCRTRGTVLAYTRFPSERLKPLSHLSEFCTLHASPGGIDSNRLRAILGPSARLRYRSGVQNAGAFCRTRGTVLAYTRFPSERLKPLSHLSEFCTLHASPGGIDSNRLRAILGPSARLRYRSGVQNAGAFCRTRGTVLAYTRFPSERLKPLSHLSVRAIVIGCARLCRISFRLRLRSPAAVPGNSSPSVAAAAGLPSAVALP